MKKKADILIKRGTVITMNEQRQIIKDGSVAIKKDRIVDIGKSAEIEKKYEGGDVFDVAGKIVMPGLIGPHLHLVESLPRGFMDDLNWWEPGTKSLSDRLWPYKLAMGKEDVYYSALLANLEMIKGGMTCFCDPAAHPEFYDEHFRATEEAGIRGVITRSNITLSPSSYEIAKNMVDTPDDAIRKTLKMIEKWEGKGSGRLRPWLGVRHVMSATEEFLRKNEKEYQRLSNSLSYRIGITAHSAFVLNDDTVVKRTGKREIEWLDSLGVLGPQWLLAHAIWYSDEEVELLKKHDVKIVHCPGTSFHCGYGASKGKFLDMLKKGITVSIGPDAGWCNNQLDMFLEMRYFAFLHKEAHMDGSAISAETAVEVATLNGARAVLWEDEIGALKSGMKADVIIVDPLRPNSIPWQDYNLVKNLVYAINGTQVETVICNGKVLMEKRRVKTLDEKDILKKSQKLAAEVAARHPLKLKSEWPII